MDINAILAFCEKAKEYNEIALYLVNSRIEYASKDENLDKQIEYINIVLTDQSEFLDLTESQHISQIRASIKQARIRCVQAKTECESIFKKQPTSYVCKTYNISYFASSILQAIGSLHEQLLILYKIS